MVKKKDPERKHTVFNNRSILANIVGDFTAKAHDREGNTSDSRYIDLSTEALREVDEEIKARQEGKKYISSNQEMTLMDNNQFYSKP